MLKASKMETSARRSWLPMSGPARRPSDHAGIRDHDAGIGDHHAGISDHHCPESLIIMPERPITMDWSRRSRSTGFRDHDRPDYAFTAKSFCRGLLNAVDHALTLVFLDSMEVVFMEQIFRIGMSASHHRQTPCPYLSCDLVRQPACEGRLRDCGTVLSRWFSVVA
jgi:hypothetical protein